MALLLAGPLIAAQDRPVPFKIVGWGVRLKVFEGVRGDVPASHPVVTSSFLGYTFSANFRMDPAQDQEQIQIKRIFNLRDVKLLTEGDLTWTAGQPERVPFVFRLDGQEYTVQINAGDLISRPQDRVTQTFGIEVFEQTGGEKKSLLDTEYNVSGRSNITVFGFEDTQGKPYFISLQHTKMYSEPRQSGVSGGVEGGVKGGVAGGVGGGVVGGVPGGAQSKEQQEFEKGAVKAVGDIKPPRLIKAVEPVYPEIARQAQVEGVVIVEARTDEKGNVEDARLLRSIPLLEQAAIDAVKQWKYEPAIINGKPQKVVFTVTVRFMLKTGNKEKDLERFAQGAVKAEGAIPPPKLIKVVDPVYPEIARQAKVEGVVILSAKTDPSGKVQDVMILRSIPLLNQAALDAVRQWVYEPLVINGVAKPVVFTVTVRFELPEKDKIKKST
jgi:TonB family protein